MRAETPWLVRPRKHRCAGTVWTLDLDLRGVAECAFCRVRAARGSAPGSSPDALLARLEAELSDARRRLLPRWVWLNPHVDAFCPAARDLTGVTLEAASALLRREVAVMLRTRGGPAEAAGLLTLARRHGPRLEVQVDLFALDPALEAAWERGAAPTESRIGLVQALAAQGAEVVVGVGPLIPFVNDDQKHLERLARRLQRARVGRLLPSWIEDGPGLVPQVTREVSKAAGRALEGWFRMPGAAWGAGRRGIAPEVRRHGLMRLRDAAQTTGLEVAVCACTDPEGRDVCVSAPAGGRQDRQLELFGQVG